MTPNLTDLFGLSAAPSTASASTRDSYPQHNFHPKGHVIDNLAKDRLRTFTGGGQFSDVNLPPLMFDGREDGNEYVNLEVTSPPGLGRPPFHEAIQLPFRTCGKGESFGPSWSTHWFRITINKIPKHFLEKERIEFHFDCEGEGMIWTTGGVPMQGLTGGGGGDRRVEYILPQEWRNEPDVPHTFYIEASMNGMFGCAEGDNIQPPNMHRYFTLHTADIVIPYMPAWHLFWDYWVITDCARELGGWEERQALTVATEIVNTFRRGDRASIDACRKVAQKFLGKHVDSHKVYDVGGDEGVLVTGIGHCHIDTAWLWPFDETKRKVARSWATQVDLMERYEEHRFACSQAQQWKWLEQYYPLLYDKVKKKVAEGRFIPIGGTWVEMVISPPILPLSPSGHSSTVVWVDTNMPSGEALVRQFMYGQRFFESRFGFRNKTFWLPDTFGYSAQLPQLARSAGMKYFFTQKLSWNNINTFPNTTFNWVALDGTQIICHMCPAETYTAQANVGDLIRSVSQHKNLGEDTTSLLVFGNGDGGGGPLAQMLEKLRRCRGVSNTIGRLPKFKMGATVDEFFEKVEKNSDYGKKLVSWHGELYFELHRGTYTSQANTKRSNRYSEVMLREIEYFATLASIHAKDYKYPKKDIDEMWENVLLCQFHDVLPGSSIEMVYDDAREIYTKVFSTGQQLLSEALSALGFKDKVTHQEEKLQVAINTLPWPRSEIVSLPNNETLGAQKDDVKQFAVVSAEAFASKVLDSPEIQLQTVGKGATITEKYDGIFVLGNGKIEVTIQGGQILSLLDIELNRQLIPKGQKANRLILYDDQPLYWDAWDVELYHLETPHELGLGKTTIVDQGPLRVGLLVEHKISEESWIKTTISLDAYIPSVHNYAEGFKDALTYLQFESEVEWHENRKFLKAEFPVDIYCDTASYESQFGIVKRPTHYNTSWDHAKFEVVCHKWADLSEFGYGVSILNDSKYGFATLGNVMRLSLLRSSKAPDGHADMGRHIIRYALLPHRGSLVEAAVVRAAYNFNHPLHIGHVATASAASKVKEIMESIQFEGTPNVILDTIKRGEDDDDVTATPIKKREFKNLVLRVYEAYGGKGKAKISTHIPITKAFVTNILEDEGDEIGVLVARKAGKKISSLEVEIRPFEVVTLRLEF